MTPVRLLVPMLLLLLAGCPPQPAPTSRPPSNSRPHPGTGPLLGRVPQLEAVARAASSGSMGCGVGSIGVVTSAGTQQHACSTDSIHVFGGVVRLAELHGLLQARAESYADGGGPMAGDLQALFYVLFEVLNVAQASDSVPYVTALLADPDPTVRQRAAGFLLALGEDEARRPVVQAVDFPLEVLIYLGDEVPDWLEQKPRAPDPPPEPEPAPEGPSDYRRR